MDKTMTKDEFVRACAKVSAKSEIMKEMISLDPALIIELAIYTVELANELFDEESEE